MTRRIIIALMAYTIGISCISAQNSKTTDANIGGHVLDTESGEHMPGCVIRILGTSLATVTDASGHYIFRDLKPGEYTLEASCTGYVTTRLETSVEPRRTVEVNFDLAPDAFMLDQVVVTSSKSETLRRESPSLVNVINGSMFQRLGACSLADGLDFQPGVRVENDCQNCGFTQVRINGLDGHYSQILMNSRPVFSALTGVYGLEQILYQHDRPRGGDARRRIGASAHRP